LGSLFFLVIAWLFSENRSGVEKRDIFLGVTLQIALAVIITQFPLIRGSFEHLSKGVEVLKRSTQEGTKFVFGYLGGGAVPFEVAPDSGVSTFIFGLQALPTIMVISALSMLLFHWGEADFYRTTELAAPYVGHFHDYLVRGGFPQTALVETINQAQKLLREDIIDKALKRDMTALFGVRRVLDLEQLFLYLCMHDGGLLDMSALCSNLQVKRGTAQNFLELLEATHLIYRLLPYGYGKEILRARYKVYLADAAIAPAVLLKGKGIIEDPDALSVATEAAVFKHLFARYYDQNVRFTYWRGKKDHEVDLIAEVNDQLIPFEIKYQSHTPTGRDIRGLIELCQEKDIQRGYVITKSLSSFGSVAGISKAKTHIMHLPAALLCYWMGQNEITHHKETD